MVSTGIMAEFNVLRARMEATLPHPAVIAATCARDGDGTSLVSSGLARSLGEAGYRVLLVNTDPGADVAFGGKPIPRLSAHRDFEICSYATPLIGGVSDVISLTSEAVANSGSGEAIANAVDQLRAAYDFIVVCAPQPLRNGIAFSFLRLADAAVVAFRHGRGSSQADRDLADILGTKPGKMLGVLTVDGARIRQFEQDGPKSLGEAVPSKRRQDDPARVQRSVA